MQVSKRTRAKTEGTYLKASSVATEILSSIRTVMAFGGEEREKNRLQYKKKILYM